ncbi:lipoprotein [Streptomyces prasinosporus]|uniref:Lipoprotein n=1 Tax=Streptomyces prasinosporus TaxID=68256 RepID=A0ABP6TFJ6_9ACTN
MSSSLRRGALAAAAIAFSIASLSACAAGNNAQTLQIKPDNAATTVGAIKIQNAVVITQPDLESTGPAVVTATLFNEGRTDQTLESITLPGTGKSAELTPAEGGSLTVPAGGSLIIGGEGNASAVLPSSREAVQDGNAQKVTFTLSETGDVSLRAFVFPAEHHFEEWGPTVAPAAPGASTEPSAESSGEPADEAAEENPDGAAESGVPADGATGAPSDAASASQDAAGS